MEQYIPKSTLVAEIKKLKMDIGNIFNEYDERFWEGRTTAFDDVICALDTLEVKEVDLEEKATQLSQKYFPDEENIWARPNIEAQKCKSACIEMVEWFKAQKGE